MYRIKPFEWLTKMATVTITNPIRRHSIGGAGYCYFDRNEGMYSGGFGGGVGEWEGVVEY